MKIVLSAIEVGKILVERLAHDNGMLDGKFDIQWKISASAEKLTPEFQCCEVTLEPK